MSQKGFHIRSLDGIRAVAVMLVFLSHTSLGAFIPGRFGVTIFFFLSGYLITTLMRKEVEKEGNLSFSNFYLRRILRIFPPLYIVLGLVMMLVYTGVFASDMKLMGVASQLLHFSNYYLIFNDESTILPGTLVTWSLAVEEHFYLLFPFVFIFLTRRMNIKRVAGTLLAFCAAILLWRCWLIYGLGISTEYTFMASDTRIDSIMFGCIMGLWLNPVLDKKINLPNKTLLIILATALFVLSTTFLIRNPEFRATFRYTLQGVALFPIFYLAISKSEWFIFRILNVAPVKALGIVSYTFYLCHLVFIFITNHYFHTNWLLDILVAFILSAGFSSLIYFLVEKKLILWRKRLHNPASTSISDSGKILTILPKLSVSKTHLTKSTQILSSISRADLH